MEIGLSFGGDEQLSQTLIPKLETYKWHEQMCSLLGGHLGSENEIVDYFSKNRQNRKSSQINTGLFFSSSVFGKQYVYWTYMNKSSNTIIDPKTGKPLQLSKLSFLTAFPGPLSRSSKNCPIFFGNDTVTKLCRRKRAYSLCTIIGSTKFSYKGIVH